MYMVLWVSAVQALSAYCRRHDTLEPSGTDPREERDLGLLKRPAHSRCRGIDPLDTVPQNGVKNSVWLAAGWRILGQMGARERPQRGRGEADGSETGGMAPDRLNFGAYPNLHPRPCPIAQTKRKGASRGLRSGGKGSASWRDFATKAVGNGAKRDGGWVG